MDSFAQQVLGGLVPRPGFVEWNKDQTKAALEICSNACGSPGKISVESRRRVISALCGSSSLAEMRQVPKITYHMARGVLERLGYYCYQKCNENRRGKIDQMPGIKIGMHPFISVFDGTTLTTIQTTVDRAKAVKSNLEAIKQ